jgi:hypothetical protein
MWGADQSRASSTVVGDAYSGETDAVELRQPS